MTNLLSYILQSLAQVIHLLINLYSFVIAISVLLSWVSPDPYNPLVRMLRQITEPVFSYVRRYLPAAFFKTGFDFTPMIVLFFLIFLDNVLVNVIMDLAKSLYKHG